MITKQEAKLIVDKIQEYQNIIIAKHQRADWDAQGSAMGFAYLIQKNWPQKTVYVPGERLDQNNDFLPDQNFNSQFIRTALLITVDTGNVDRLDFLEWNQAKEIIKFDHHLPVDQYGTYNIVDVHAIACAQMVALWGKMLQLEFNSQAAENLYKGIVTDSGRFLFPRTSAETFEIASFLLTIGFDFERVNNHLYVSNLKTRQWTNYAFSKMKLSPQGVGYILIEPEDYQGRDLNYNEIKLALGTMSGIEEIKIWFVVINIEDEYKVSLRSRDYDVNLIATKYNGGGHRLASGARLANFTDYKKVLADLEQLIVETDKENN